MADRPPAARIDREETEPRPGAEASHYRREIHFLAAGLGLGVAARGRGSGAGGQGGGPDHKGAAVDHHLGSLCEALH